MDYNVCKNHCICFMKHYYYYYFINIHLSINYPRFYRLMGELFDDPILQIIDRGQAVWFIRWFLLPMIKTVLDNMRETEVWLDNQEIIKPCFDKSFDSGFRGSAFFCSRICVSIFSNYRFFGKYGSVSSKRGKT